MAYKIQAVFTYKDTRLAGENQVKTIRSGSSVKEYVDAARESTNPDVLAALPLIQSLNDYGHYVYRF